MKIALFTDTYLPTVDGVVNSVINTKRALQRMGHDVLVIAPEDRKNGSVQEEDTLYCRAREFKRYPGYRIALYPAKKELEFLQECGTDIIHSHGIAFMGLKGMWAARELGLPMVLTFHTMILDAIPYYTSLRPRSHLLKKLISVYLRGFLHHCGAVVTPTEAILNELRTIAPRMRRTAVVPSGVDVTRFRPELDGSPVRERHDLGDAEVILYVGRVAPEKDIGFLLEAFPRLLREKPGSKLLVVGTGPYLARCQMYVEKKGLNDSIIFTSFVPDEELPLYYAACDALAIASKFETQGLVVLEAMACGKPVAAVNYRAFPEYIKDGFNGFLFAPGDLDGCCQAILKALDSGEEVKRRARETAERFSLDTCTRRLVSLYEDMVS
ncbi:MAG: glycosyltransferase [Thermoplasmata archaeon]